jgi:hypothetical protein
MRNRHTSRRSIGASLVGEFELNRACGDCPYKEALLTIGYRQAGNICDGKRIFNLITMPEAEVPLYQKALVSGLERRVYAGLCPAVVNNGEELTIAGQPILSPA